MARTSERLFILTVSSNDPIHPALKRRRSYASLDNAMKAMGPLVRLYLRPLQTLELSHAITGRQLAWQRRLANGYTRGWCLWEE